MKRIVDTQRKSQVLAGDIREFVESHVIGTQVVESHVYWQAHRKVFKIGLALRAPNMGIMRGQGFKGPWPRQKLANTGLPTSTDAK